LRRGGLWLFVSACLLTGAYFGASRLGLLDRLQARFFPRKLKLSSGDFPAGVAAPLGGAAIPLRPVRVGFVPRGSSAGLLVAAGGASFAGTPEPEPAPEGLLKASYDLNARAIAFTRDEELMAALRRGADEGGVDAAAMTVDRLAEWAPALRDAAPRAILLLGRSQGLEALASVGPKTLQELRGKKVAVARHTPCEYFALWLTARAGLAVDDVQWVEVPTVADAGKALREGRVDAAVGYAGDLELTLREHSGQMIASTADAPHLVATVLVARGEFAARYPDAIRRLVRGLLDAGRSVNKDPQEGARRLGEVAPYLGDPNEAIRLGPPASLDDNLGFFGMRGEPPVTFAELFSSAGALFVRLGRTAAVPDPDDVRDLAALRYASGIIVSPKP
jgi:ABC-type nitrate/sulfonate/bicarbonate transport system substrate-binding protein